MTNLKKVFLVMLVVMLLGATVAFATDDTSTIIITPQNTVVGGTENTVDTNTVTTNTTTQNTVVINTTTNTSTYNTTNTTSKLPQTGADDYAVITIIAVLAVVAIYAYKKIRDYKNI
jgi:LPXTG-motif cell wall-anchored protein